MALSPRIFTQQIRLAAPTLVGKDWLRMTSAIGRAVYSWIVVPANVQLQGVSVGVLGAGSVPTGKVVVAPSLPQMSLAFNSVGLNGADSLRISKAVALGVANAINASGEYYGVSVGAGSGVDTCKTVLANGAALKGLLVSQFASIGVTGADAIKLAQAISVGVSSILLTGVGTGAVVGSVSPIPSSGTTTLFMR